MKKGAHRNKGRYEQVLNDGEPEERVKELGRESGNNKATNDIKQQQERQSDTEMERLTAIARNKRTAFWASAIRQHIPE